MTPIGTPRMARWLPYVCRRMWNETSWILARFAASARGRCCSEAQSADVNLALGSPRTRVRPARSISHSQSASVSSSRGSRAMGALDPSSDRNAPYMQLYQGCFMIVSGLPGGGKTAWTTQLAFNMARLHGWRAAIASFEMRVTPTLRDMLRGFYIAEARDLVRNPSAIPETSGQVGPAPRSGTLTASSRSSSRSPVAPLRGENPSGSPCRSPAMPNGRCRMHGESRLALRWVRRTATIAMAASPRMLLSAGAH